MISEFTNNHGKEVFITLEPEATGRSFADAVRLLFAEYDRVCRETGLSEETAIYHRVFLSDIYNQAHVLEEYLQDKTSLFFCSPVGQAPASGARIALEAYHIRSYNTPVAKEIHTDRVVYCHNQYQSVWGYLVPSSPRSSYLQTEEILGNLTTLLTNWKAKLNYNVLRTWFYIRDIDNNYAGMVDCRREVFHSMGMTEETNYISSTGIEGCSFLPRNLVHFMYICDNGVRKDQVRFMSAPEYMNPTHEYGVTFERGTHVLYGDRSHYYISGTASIDKCGNVLYPHDILKQAGRVLTNIEALLDKYYCELKDLKILLVYLRDFSEYPVVKEYLNSRLPGSLAYIILKAPVCRPGWLIEIEGVAINRYCDEVYPSFL